MKPFWAKVRSSSATNHSRQPAWAGGKVSRKQRWFLFLEELESRTLLSGFVYRSIDGSGNNPANPSWGQAGTDLLRLSAVAYADGINTLSLPNNPSARVTSNNINVQADGNNLDIQTVDQNSLSDFGYAWGQFIDHDLDNSPNGTESAPIWVPPGDPIGPSPLPFDRSQYDPNTGTSRSNPRQQTNAITSYMDLSNVYGSSTAVEAALRTFTSGQLQTSPGNMLPYDNNTYFTNDQITALNMANSSGAVQTSALFAAGDVRANENIELTALQTLFVRNHNAIAVQLQQQNPTWTDEQLFQEARKLNIAEEETITYTQWLPDLLGPNALPAYKGYNSSVDAAIANEFTTVGFRFGHSLLSNLINRQGNDGQPVQVPINLAVDFFDPNLLNPAGVIDPLTGLVSTDIDPILKGDADGDSQSMDVMAINEVRNLLFGNGGQGGSDLISDDVQRARDHGIGSYNQVRAAYGLPKVTQFWQITSNPAWQYYLLKTYGNVNNVDAFEGGLAENHVRGSDVGPLFQAIMVDQFRRLRDGDSFFYLNEQFSPAEQAILNQGNTLAKVIEANTHLTNLQNDVMGFKASLSGTVFDDFNGDGKQEFGEPGQPGYVVNLEDTSGDVLAMTLTDFQGHYNFNQLSIPSLNLEIAPGFSATGDYTVVLAANPFELTASPGTIEITSGDANVKGANFGLDIFDITMPARGAAIQASTSHQVSFAPRFNPETSTAKVESTTSMAADTAPVPSKKTEIVHPPVAARKAEMPPNLLGATDELFGRLWS
jgi:hypothetical protein